MQEQDNFFSFFIYSQGFETRNAELYGRSDVSGLRCALGAIHCTNKEMLVQKDTEAFSAGACKFLSLPSLHQKNFLCKFSGLKRVLILVRVPVFFGFLTCQHSL